MLPASLDPTALELKVSKRFTRMPYFDEKAFWAERVARNIHQLFESEELALIHSPEFRSRVVAAYKQIWGQGAELVIEVPEPNHLSVLWFRPSNRIYKIPEDAEDETEALVEELDQSLIDLIRTGRVSLTSLTPIQFEEVMGEILIKYGYTVSFTKQTHDGGYDIIAFRKEALGFETPLIVQCKRYKDRKVGVAAVRELHGVQTTMNIPHALLATTSYFSPEAKHFATQLVRWGLYLADHDDIIRWITQEDIDPNKYL